MLPFLSTIVSAAMFFLQADTTESVELEPTTYARSDEGAASANDSRKVNSTNALDSADAADSVDLDPTSCARLAKGVCLQGDHSLNSADSSKGYDSTDSPKGSNSSAAHRSLLFASRRPKPASLGCSHVERGAVVSEDEPCCSVAKKRGFGEGFDHETAIQIAQRLCELGDEFEELMNASCEEEERRRTTEVVSTWKFVAHLVHAVC